MRKIQCQSFISVRAQAAAESDLRALVEPELTIFSYSGFSIRPAICPQGYGYCSGSKIREHTLEHTPRLRVVSPQQWTTAEDDKTVTTPPQAIRRVADRSISPTRPTPFILTSRCLIASRECARTAKPTRRSRAQQDPPTPPIPVPSTSRIPSPSHPPPRTADVATV